MYTYQITGSVTDNDSQSTVTIDETITVDEMSAQSAFDKFFADNDQYDFFGSLKSCDQETRGKKGATYRDQNEDQTVDVELVS